MKSMFSFKGRATRKTFWLTSLALTVVVIVLVLAQVQVFGTIGGLHSIWIIVPAVWIAFAVGVRRLHDRAKPWWWVLIFYVLPNALTAPLERMDDTSSPSLIVIFLAIPGAFLSLWGLVEMGFLPGTTGENRFGPDPKA